MSGLISTQFPMPNRTITTCRNGATILAAAQTMADADGDAGVADGGHALTVRSDRRERLIVRR
jgi:hypothetical protein